MGTIYTYLSEGFVSMHDHDHHAVAVTIYYSNDYAGVRM